MGAVYLHQFAETGFPFTPLPVLSYSTLFVGDRRFVQPKPERFIAYSDPMYFGKLLGSMGKIEVRVLSPEQPKRLALDSWRYLVV
jgi:hypothetical protein